jgi:tetratricopeptide (TPR) repeat protein
MKLSAPAMKQLEPPDSHHLSAAEGWLELGNAGEADIEIEKISPELRTHPHVLDIRWNIAATRKRWPDCIEAAEAMMQIAPDRLMGWIHRSYALHELKRTREAFELLRPAADLFPKEWLTSYNLACYSCQLGKPEEALAWLAKAVVLGDAEHIREMALADPDLHPLKTDLAKIWKWAGQ